MIRSLQAGAVPNESLGERIAVRMHLIILPIHKVDVS